MKNIILSIFGCLVLSGQLFSQNVESFQTDDGETLFYYRKGTGPGVVLLYGGPGYDANLMLNWLDSSRNNFECILFDRRGTGLSSNVKVDSSTTNLERACQDPENLKMRPLMTKDIFKSLDLREPLKKYRGRCTTIRPRQDSVPEEVPWKIKESVPQTKFVFIERCGHMVDLEKPAEFFAKLRQALTE